MYNTWACYGFGLVLSDEDEIRQILKVNYPDKEEEIEDWDIYDMHEYFNQGSIADADCGDVDIRLVDDNEETIANISPDYALCLYAKHQPTATKAAYKNLDEYVEELKAMMKWPDDFDFKKHIGYFSWVDFG